MPVRSDRPGKSGSAPMIGCFTPVRHEDAAVITESRISLPIYKNRLTIDLRWPPTITGRGASLVQDPRCDGRRQIEADQHQLPHPVRTNQSSLAKSAFARAKIPPDKNNIQGDQYQSTPCNFFHGIVQVNTTPRYAKGSKTCDSYESAKIGSA